MSPRDIASSARAAPCVLVVDDDGDIRETLAEALREAGYDVVTAADGRQALELVRRAAGRCVMVLDLMMPVMDGWQVLGELRSEPALSARVSVVVLSAVGHRALATLRPLAAATLAKPVELDALLLTVARCLAA